ncbi:MAG: hypothetical protein ACI8Y3_001588, partial [Paraglaciecola sp.]
KFSRRIDVGCCSHIIDEMKCFPKTTAIIVLYNGVET